MESETKEYLQHRWAVLMRYPHSQEFADFEAFAQWSLQNGYVQGSRLFRINPEVEYSPRNCVWRTDLPVWYTEEHEKRAWQWEHVVNALRKKCGLPRLGEAVQESVDPRWLEIYKKIPTPKSHPCERCALSDTCDRICPARAKWWDRGMAELREVIRA